MPFFGKHVQGLLIRTPYRTEWKFFHHIIIQCNGLVFLLFFANTIMIFSSEWFTMLENISITTDVY